MIGSEGPLDTIVSEATPPGRGGVALLRISGPDAHLVASRLFAGSSRRPPSMRRCVHGHVRLQDGSPDEATCTLFVGPASFTGEDVAEIGVHGNPWVVLSQLGLACRSGARLARPGEFSYRAWLNGRLDLTRAEALDALIRASSPAAASEAARQAAGGLGEAIEELRELVVEALAELEAAVDFHDDSQGQRRIDEALARAGEAAKRRLGEAGRGRILDEGLRVVLSGPPNAGKSSLFNALLADERAIVTEEPGTTRDLLEGRLVLDGRPILLVDTAGERPTSSAAEAEGLRRGRRARSAADLVLEVWDARLPRVEGTSGKARLVLNKIDLLDADSRAALLDGSGVHRLSARTGQGLDALIEDLREESRTACSGEGAVLFAARQRELAKVLHDRLDEALEGRRAGHSEEYVAESLREALGTLAELVGATDPEAVYERIFSRFCVGK